MVLAKRPDTHKSLAERGAWKSEHSLSHSLWFSFLLFSTDVLGCLVRNTHLDHPQLVNPCSLLKKHQDHGDYWAFVREFSRKEVTDTVRRPHSQCHFSRPQYPQNLKPCRCLSCTQLKKLRCVKTGRGLGRAWIRLALNEASLESYLTMFADDNDNKPKFYSRWVLGERGRGM